MTRICTVFNKNAFSAKEKFAFRMYGKVLEDVVASWNWALLFHRSCSFLVRLLLLWLKKGVHVCWILWLCGCFFPSATFPWLAHTNNITLPPLFLLSTIKFANFPLGAERLWQHWHGWWPLIRPRYRNSFPHKIQLGNWFLAKTKQGKHLFHLHLNIKF